VWDDGSESFEIGVQLPDGIIKRWNINWTSQNAVALLYGDDTQAWIGKKAKVRVTEQMVKKQLKKAT